MNTESVDIPMTDEQRFIFDLKGWICIPNVLTESETETIRQHIIDLKDDPESIDPLERYSLAGPAQILLDHPAVVGVLREILDNDLSNDCYGFRCENSFSIIRKKGQTGLSPHGGYWHGAHGYRVYRDRIYSGLSGRFSTGNVFLKENMFDLTNEIITFGPKMAHDDTIETLYYAQLHAFPPNMRQNESKKDWFKPKKRAKSWVIA